MKRFRGIWLVALSLVLCVGCATTGGRLSGTAMPQEDVPPGAMLYDAPVKDSLSGFNRAMMMFNGGLNNYVLYPLGVFYTWAMPECVREGVDNFALNLGYPLRLVNACLQGRFGGAWDETRRFAVNTTVGVLGFRDQATRWNIPLHKEDFGKTFERWGMGPGCYLYLPFLGPSSARDAVGTLLGVPLNLANILLPSGTARGVTATGYVNSALSDAQENYQLSHTIYNPYELSRALYITMHEAATLDNPASDITGDPDPSFGNLLLEPKDSVFRDNCVTYSIRLPGSARRIPYSCWIRQRVDASGRPPRTLVILPGIGGHRMAQNTCALAELFYRRGWSVIAFSSTLTPDFFQGLPGRRFPGDFERDSADLDQAIALALRDFQKRHPGRGGDSCTVLGWSLGGINAMQLAARGVSFPCDKFVALNPPPRPFHALQTIDQWAARPRQWDVPDKDEAVRALMRRIARKYQEGGEALQKLPVTREESEFLIGFYMQMPLLNLLTANAKIGRYAEGIGAQVTMANTMRLGWTGYAEKVILPQYREGGHAGATLDDMVDALSLTSQTAKLAACDRAYIIHNEDDFLVTQEDLAWFRSTFGTRASFFSQGGHTGNYHVPEFQKKLVDIIDP